VGRDLEAGDPPQIGGRIRRRTWLAAAAVAVVVAAAVPLALTVLPGSPGSGNPTLHSSAVAGGTARVALPAGVTYNWIWPFIPVTSANEYNTGYFEELMYRPMYVFGNNGPSVQVNYPLSVADAPAYSADGTTVTITMKGWKWSNGETVSARDVVFWLNMMKAEPANYYGYTPGLLPDNLASYSATGPDTMVLHLKSAVSSIWFTYDQLAEITPMPMAWDVTSATAKAGSGGCTTDSAQDKWAKCTAVFNFLTAQSKTANTYATNPIWAVVDGPWKLTSFSTASAGLVTSMAPNAAYSGSPKSKLAGLDFYGYLDDATEYEAMKTGQLDVGYIPPADLTPVSGSQVLPATNPLGSAYTLAPNYAFGIQYFLINFNNPTLGPAYKQLYVRQAIQESIDQVGMIKAVLRGYGYPTSGAVPALPKNQWVPSVQNANGGQGPYAFNLTSARNLLTSHGWSEVGGVMTCETPAKCGPSVTKGTTLTMTMDYATGIQAFQQEVAVIKPDAVQAGIDINLVPQSFSTIIGETTPCKPGPKCTWDILDFGGWDYNGPGYEPTGELLFATGASSNSGSYSDPTEDRLINLTRTSSSLSVFDQYATYTAQQLPFMWLPNGYTVQAVSAKMANVGFNPLATLLPEYWNFTTSPRSGS
jgi:peptide/nickel transport system substrate-binding protein